MVDSPGSDSTMPSDDALSAGDARLLRSIVSQARNLELQWPNPLPDARLGADVLRCERDELRNLVLRCATAHAESLRRLARHSSSLTASLTPRHLTAVIVPFERLLNRSLRDDEILVNQVDKMKSVEPDVHSGHLIVLADNLRSAFNVGAVMRTSECFAVREVILCGYTPTPAEPKTARTSMGTEDYIAWQAGGRIEDQIGSLQNEGYKIVALETVEGATGIDDFRWPEQCALVIGNERFGIDREVLRQADHCIQIPLFGRKNSLNVGIALGLALSSWQRYAARYFSSLPKQEQPKDQNQPEVSTEDTVFQPIAIFHGDSLRPYEARRQGSEKNISSGSLESDDSPSVSRKGDEAENLAGTISFKEGFEQGLSDLNGIERIWVLYGFHLNKNWKMKVLPPRGPRTKRGVFATRAPYRPNPIGLSCVELIEVRGRDLVVRDCDLLDGSPIYDIKPYLPYCDSFPLAKVGWLTGIERDLYEVKITEPVIDALRWLSEHGLTRFGTFLHSQLEYAPTDKKRKRVRRIETEAGLPNKRAVFEIAYRTWRARFWLLEETKLIEVFEIRSGYRANELQAQVSDAGEDAVAENTSQNTGSFTQDPHLDKDLHREFQLTFLERNWTRGSQS